MVMATIVAVLTFMDVTTPWVLLGFTFAFGVRAALSMPAWASIVPELVPKDSLTQAPALNGVAINVSRAIGPAIAGVLVAAVGPWLVFALNAASYVAILTVRWRREPRKSALPAERVASAIRVGMRFVAHTRSLQNVLVRGIAFFVFASATWSLFPIIIRRELGRAPETYGALLTCIGIGAVAGAMLLPRVRAKMTRDALVASATVLYAASALALAHLHNLVLLAVAMLATGMAGIAILSALQVSAQLSLPAWVRARGIAAFVVVFMGGMAFGSVLWGQLATRIGIPYTLTVAALLMVVAIGLTWKFKLGSHEVLDFTPSMDWPAPVLMEDPEPDRGPVMVTIEYRVQPSARADFTAAMDGVREMRRRNGAYFWELFHDSADPARFVECFMDESWLDHLRQHERVSVADRGLQARANAFLVPGDSTRTVHWLADRRTS